MSAVGIMTPELLRPFMAPSVWGETDCIRWGEMVTGITLDSQFVWKRQSTEARALARAIRIHGSYIDATFQILHALGFKEVDLPWQPTDVVLVNDASYGPSLCGVAETGELILRHPGGLARASGDLLHIFRHQES